MRTMLSLAAAALAVGFSAGVAFADDDSDQPQINGAFTLDTLVPNTTFDLGIDVNAVPRNPAAVQGYLASLRPDTRAMLIRTCQNYMTYPSSAQERETVSFCALALGG